MSNLSFQYPLWYLVLPVLAGVLFATLLYARDKSFQEQQPWVKWLMAAMRFLAVTAMGVMLMAPFLRQVERQSQRPILVFAHDMSESIRLGMTNSEARKQYLNAWNKLTQELGSEYDVKQYRFGGDLREGAAVDTFMDKTTNYATLFQGIYDQYSNQNLGAIVMASDGIFNEGSNPTYLSSKLTAPVYCVALGDTTPRKDLVIKQVLFNKIAYLGDKVSIQVDVAATNAAGASSSLSLAKVNGGNVSVIGSQGVQVSGNDYFNTLEFLIDANPAGIQRYRLSLSGVAGEVNKTNNTRDIYIEVLDARQKVLLLAASPHPDLSAIKQSLEANKNYDVRVEYIQDVQVDIATFDLVILHQLPSRRNDISAVMNTLNSRQTPRWFIVGSQTDLSRLNQYQDLVRIQGDGQSSNDVQATVNPGFGYFTLDEQLRSQLATFPPLISPFGEYSAGASGQALLYQRIGKVDTDYPLLVLGDAQGKRTGVLCAEGLWQWRLFDFLQHDNHDLTNNLVSKIVQYVGIKEDKRRFRVNQSKNLYAENEPVLFSAELYNESYELVNEPDVVMTIRDANGKDYTFTFNKSGKAYTLNTGILPVGDYTYRASTSFGGKAQTADGRFSVQAIQLESYDITANHSLLRLIANEYGGELIAPSKLSSLADILRKKDTLKPVIYETVKTKPLIDWKWLFGLLLLWLAIEWFMRRYFGAY